MGIVFRSRLLMKTPPQTVELAQKWLFETHAHLKAFREIFMESSHPGDRKHLRPTMLKHLDRKSNSTKLVLEKFKYS